MIAGKTGYTDAAWCTFVSVAERNGMKLIEATMKAANSIISFTDAGILFDYGFYNFQNLVVKESENGYDGGLITVPNGVALEDVSVIKGEPVETSLGIMTEETYEYHGHKVGTVEISYDEIAQIEAEEQAEAARIEAEKEALRAEKEKKDLEHTEKTQKVIRLIMMIMIALVFIGMITILVSLILKKRRKNKK